MLFRSASKQWHELADALHRTVDAGAATMDDRAITHVYMQLGHLYSSQLEQPLDAAEAYRNALDVNPGYADALAASRHAPWSDPAQHPCPGCFVCGPLRAAGDGRVAVLQARSRQVLTERASHIPDAAAQRDFLAMAPHRIIQTD